MRREYVILEIEIEIVSMMGGGIHVSDINQDTRCCFI